MGAGLAHRASRLWALAALLLGVAGPAQAHDTWVMPTTFRVPAGQPISTLLSAGHGLTPLSAPRRRRLRVLQLVDSLGRREPDRWQRGGKTAQAHFSAAAPGVACLALSTLETLIDIEPDTVDKYLGEVQPPAAIVAAWQRQRARGEAWIERYGKDAKTYLRSGDDSTGWPALAQLGHALELVPQSDPTRLEPGDTLRLVLHFKGQPAADVALRLFNSAGDERVVRTGTQGGAQFKRGAPGPHLVATTLIQVPASAGAPWTSRFATLGFGVGSA
ncbi:MAG: DUF4198 domain-containing protein [Rubrivivax sp.]